MAKYFRGRTAEEVKKLIEAHGYKLTNHDGDDEIWTLEGKQFTVKVPNRNEVIKIGTMDYIKRMLVKNGLSRKEILKWWKDNGYGE